METSSKEIDNETQVQSYLYETEGWIDFYLKNQDIITDIVGLFNEGTYGFIRHNNYLGLTTQYIALALDKPIIYIRHQLSLWFTYYCTYYAKYGRIHYIPDKKIWFYEPKS